MEPESAKFCPSCGRRRGADDRFCAGCGQPLDRSEQPAREPDAPEQARRPPDRPAQPAWSTDRPAQAAWSPIPAERPARPRPPPWDRLRLLVPIAILAVGYWLIAPLVWPAVAPDPLAVEAPTAVPGGAQPVAPPGLGGSRAASPSPAAAGSEPPVVVGRGGGVPSTGTGQSPPPSQARGEGSRTPAAAGPTEAAARAEALSPAAAPGPAATPTPSVYRGSPVEALKVEPRQVQTVRLGRIETGTLVRMSFSIAFNSPLSTVTGVPDIDLFVVGPTGTVAAYPDARDGVRVAFEAPATGDYEVRLDNSKSRINAKRVGIQFG
ncbi:MAG TPA: hypothetical protein VGM69_24575 [Chloroflexota bacterium]